jgi:hypothetical protein
MYKYLFNRVKKIIPKISETEIIALKSGGVSIDREIFTPFLISNAHFEMRFTPFNISNA